MAEAEVGNMERENENENSVMETEIANDREIEIANIGDIANINNEINEMIIVAEIETGEGTSTNACKRVRRNPSAVWKYFIKVDQTSCVCSLCNEKFKTKCGSTTALRRHIKQKHNEVCESVESASEPSAGTSGASNLKGSSSEAQPQPMLDKNSKRAQELTSAIANMIISDFQPYDIVNDIGFKEFVRIAEPLYEIPHRTTFSRRIIPEMYKKEMARIKNTILHDFTSNDARVAAFTTDGWTSRATDSYLSLTMHYCSNQFEIKKYTLAIRHYPESHSSVNLNEFLSESLYEWGINDNKVECYFVTDNAANMIRAITLTEKWNRISCFAHTLQLVIKDTVKNIQQFDELCNKCRQIVGFFNRSTVARANLLHAQTVHSPDTTPLQLIKDVETRWNSQYDMLKRLSQLRLPLSIVLAEPKMPDNLTSLEWDTVKAYCDVLEPFKEATVLMSGDKYPTLSRYLPVVVGLIKSMEAMAAENKEDAHEFVRNAKAALQSRFGFIFSSKPIIVAMMVDPRVKNRLLDDTQKILASELLQEEMRNLCSGTELTDNDNTVASTSVPNTGTNSSWLSKFLNDICEEDLQDTSNTNVQREYTNYCDEKLLPSNTDILNWWSNNSKRFPTIAKVAQNFLAVPATQVSSERIFSTAGNIVTNRRARLLTEHVEEICFLHENKKKN